MTSGIDPAATAQAWPGWTYEEFAGYLTEVLPPVMPLPGSLAKSRPSMIDEAWLHPLSIAGFFVEAHFTLQNLAPSERFQKAKTLTDNLAAKSGSTEGFTIQGVTMPALVIPNVYLCSIHATMGGQDHVNVVGLRGTSSGQAAEAAAAVLAGWKVANGPLVQKINLYTMSAVRAMDLSTIDGAIAEVLDSTAGGFVTTTSGYAGACALVKWNGASRSRSSRGRLYHGAISEGAINADGRTLSSGTRTSLVTAYTNFKNTVSAAGFNLCVVSRKLGAAYDVSSIAVESTLATQRRRVRS